MPTGLLDQMASLLADRKIKGIHEKPFASAEPAVNYYSAVISDFEQTERYYSTES
jgi:hypothetical protein